MAREPASALAPSIAAYLEARRAQGNRVRNAETGLARLDRLAAEVGWESPVPGRELVEAFVGHRPGERPGTEASRRSAVAGLSRWLARRGEAGAYVPGSRPAGRSPFVPVVMSEDEAGRLLAAADDMAPTARSPARHLVVPAMLRTIYACGLRVSEARLPARGDVDPDRGVITVDASRAKSDKGRYVPMSGALLERLSEYDRAMGVRGRSAPLFPSPKGFYRTCTIDRLFLALLAAAGIPHTDDGPTVHGLRHSFACHRIMRWARDGEDASALLPLLASFLGHEGTGGTERYLRPAAETVPDLREAVEERLSWAVPGVS